MEQLAELFIKCGIPAPILSDNGPKVAGETVRSRLRILGVKALIFEPGSPGESGYIGSFDGKFRDDCKTEIPLAPETTFHFNVPVPEETNQLDISM